MRFHDPRGDVATPVEPYTLGIDLRNGADVTVGLLANGFPDSENFLNAVGNALKEIVPGLKIAFWNKGNASIPAPEEMLNDIRRQCGAVVAAYGH